MCIVVDICDRLLPSLPISSLHHVWCPASLSALVCHLVVCSGCCMALRGSGCLCARVQQHHLSGSRDAGVVLGLASLCSGACTCTPVVPSLPISFLHAWLHASPFPFAFIIVGYCGCCLWARRFSGVCCCRSAGHSLLSSPSLFFVVV